MHAAGGRGGKAWTPTAYGGVLLSARRLTVGGCGSSPWWRRPSEGWSGGQGWWGDVEHVGGGGGLVGGRAREGEGVR